MTTSPKNESDDQVGPETNQKKKNRKVVYSVVAVAMIAILGAGAFAVNSIESSHSSYYGNPAEYSMSDSSRSSLDTGTDFYEKSSDSIAGNSQSSPTVITTGSLSLTVETPSKTSKEIVRIVEASGGRIDSASEQPGNEYQPDTASLTVRIPSSDYMKVAGEIEELGRITYSTVNLSDVGTQLTEYEIRSASLEKSITRLQEMLTVAGTTSDLIQIESELSNRESELEILKSNQTSLKDQVAYSTLYVELTSKSESVNPDPENFFSGFQSGWTALLAFGSSILVGAGVILPWLMAAGVLGLIALSVLKIRSKKNRQ